MKRYGNRRSLNLRFISGIRNKSDMKQETTLMHYSVDTTGVVSTRPGSASLLIGKGSATCRVRSVVATVVAVGMAAAMSASVLAATAHAAAEFDLAADGPLFMYPGGERTVEVVVSNSGDAPMATDSVELGFGVEDGLAITGIESTGVVLFGTPLGPAFTCAIAPGGASASCTGPTATYGTISPGQDACGIFDATCPVIVTVRAALDAPLGVSDVDVTATSGGASSPGSTQVPIRIKRFGDAFGLAPINDGAGPADESPAHDDATRAFWAGACDTAAAAPLDDPVGGDGFGVRPATIPVAGGANVGHVPGPAPATPPHCLDWGAVNYATGSLWGTSPAWRLPAQATAGSHPDGTATMVMAREGDGGNEGLVDGSVDNIIVDLPPGFVGNPEAVPACTNEQFAKLPVTCPPETQVGVINLDLSAPPTGGANLPGPSFDTLYPIWNLEPRQGRAAEFGLSWASNQRAVPVRLTGKVRSGSDRGITAMVGQVPAALPLVAQSATLWGIPWEATNDKWRAPQSLANSGQPCNFQPGPNDVDNHYIPASGFTASGCAQSYDPSWGPIKPFLTQETDCNQEPDTTIRMDQYSDPGAFVPWDEPDHDDPSWRDERARSPPVTACGSLDFTPNINFTATSRSADGASGLVAELSIPQDNDARDAQGDLLDPPGVGASQSEVDEYVQAATDYFDSAEGRATAHLKDTVVELPVGMSINPSGAAGLAGCPDSVIGVRQDGDPPLFDIDDPSDGLGGDDCPEGSRIGTVEVDTPLLEEPLTGDVILGQPRAADIDCGSPPARRANCPLTVRMFLVVRDPERGLLLKIFGTATSDPTTGKITATFRNNPELPFSDLRLDVKGGERGMLALPRACGDAAWSSAFTPWSSVGAATPVPDTPDSGAVPVDARCGGGFVPAMAAGMDNRSARSSGTFSFRFTRPQGDQTLRGLTAKLPTGLLASVKGLPLCKDANAAAGTCPAGSKIGIVDAAAGSGDPFVLEEKGEVFLTEGYKGGEYGLAVKVRAIAGPFRGAMELSPIIVRQAIHVDRKTAQVTAVSDPFPQVWHGVPLRVREVTVLVNRDKFMLNPSDCEPKQVQAAITSTEGTVANLSNPFQASGCAALPFKPKLTLALTGKKQKTTGKHPGVKAKVTQAGIGEAGIEKAVVRLPKSLALDPDNAQALCEFEDGTKDDIEKHCPKGSIVGRARATSPLLNDPLVGNVYFVKNIRTDAKTGNQIRTLPMIMVALRGEIAINLKGESDTTKDGKLVNTFDNVPDAPVSQFNLNINGGSSGILAVTRTRRSLINLCAGRHVAEADMDGQNGRRHDTNIRMGTPCSKKQTKKAKRAAKRAAKARNARG
jgi:hypothetical protein